PARGRSATATTSGPAAGRGRSRRSAACTSSSTRAAAAFEGIIMRVSAKAEYACIAMLELAANFAEPQPVRVKAIADAHGIPLRFLVQILLQLKTAGLVASVRGAAGGYQLARRPADITLADIIGAIDPEQTARPTGQGPPSPAR